MLLCRNGVRLWPDVVRQNVHDAWTGWRWCNGDHTAVHSATLRRDWTGF